MRPDSKTPINTRLVFGTPVRRIPRGRRGLRGRTNVHGTDVDYESGLERDLLLLLDFDPTVVEVVGQPVRFDFTHPVTGRRTRYTPDAYARFGGVHPREVIFECKYREDLWEEFQDLKHGFKEARKAAREHGMTFRILTEVEIRGPFLDNVNFLRRYMGSDMPADTDLEERIAATLAALGDGTPESLMAATFWSEERRAHALPYMWKMIASGRIVSDLREPLTMSSPITIVLGEGYKWTDPFSRR